MQLTSRPARLFLTVAGVEMILGLTLYFFPGDYAVPVYDGIRPYFRYFSLALLIGSMTLVLMSRQPLPKWQKRALALLPTVPLAALALIWAGSFWGATILYGVLAAAVLVEPWLPEIAGAPWRPWLLEITVAAIISLLGGLMIVDPGAFSAPAYDPVRPMLVWIGLSGLLGAASLVILHGTGLLAPDSWLRRTCNVILLLALSYSFFRYRAWTGALTLFALALAIFTARVTGARLHRATVEGALETWLWALLVLILTVSTVTVDTPVVPTPMLMWFTAGVTLYNLLAFWVLPRWGSPQQRLAGHLAFATLAVGYLMTGSGNLSRVLLILLAIPPLLGQRLLGPAAGLRLLLLALATEVLPQLWLWRAGTVSLRELLEHVPVDILLLLFTFRVLSTDISARRRAEQALQAAEDRFSRIFESSPVATAITTLTGGRFLHANSALCELVGYSRPDIEGRTSLELGLVSPQTRTAIVADLGQQGAARNHEFVMRNRAGQERSLLQNAEIIQLEGEDCVLGLYQDITESRRAEAELRRRARAQSAVAELGQQALGGGDLEALLQRATSLCAEVLEMEYCKVLQVQSGHEGLLLRAGVGWRPGLVGTAIVGTELSSQAGFTLLSRQPVVVTDLRTEQRFSGPPLLRDHGVVSGISTLIGAFDQPWGVFGVHSKRALAFTGEDVNFVQSVANVVALAISRKAAEDRSAALNAELEQRVALRTRELAAANRDLATFAYSVSHDLRAPLRSIDGFSKLALDRFGHQIDGDLADFLQRVRLASQNMGKLIDDLLALSRVTRWELKPQPVDLSGLAKGILAELQEGAPERQVEWQVHANLNTRGDPRLLGIALRNLLDNAWKFSSTRDVARIEVGSLRQGQETVYYVRDSGVGFDPAYKDKLFAAFERLHRESEFAGTGVGLATVHRIIDRHGGRIWAESAVDQGATFYFTINRKQEGNDEEAPDTAG